MSALQKLFLYLVTSETLNSDSTHTFFWLIYRLCTR